MNKLERSFRVAVHDLAAAGHASAVIGGLAVSARALAFDAARLIEERGFSRGRRLIGDLERLLAEFHG